MKTLSDMATAMGRLNAVLDEMPLHHTWAAVATLAERYAGNVPLKYLDSYDRLKFALATAIVEANGSVLDKKPAITEAKQP